MGRNCSICEWASGGGGSEKYCTPSETQRTVVALRLEKCNVIKTKWKKLYRDGTEEKGEIHFCLVFFCIYFFKNPPVVFLSVAFVLLFHSFYSLFSHLFDSFYFLIQNPRLHFGFNSYSSLLFVFAHPFINGYNCPGLLFYYLFAMCQTIDLSRYRLSRRLTDLSVQYKNLGQGRWLSRAAVVADLSIIELVFVFSSAIAPVCLL